MVSSGSCPGCHALPNPAAPPVHSSPARQAGTTARLAEAHSALRASLVSLWARFAGDSEEVAAEWLAWLRRADAALLEGLTACVRRSLHEVARALQGEHKGTELSPVFVLGVYLDTGNGRWGRAGSKPSGVGRQGAAVGSGSRAGWRCGLHLLPRQCHPSLLRPPLQGGAEAHAAAAVRHRARHLQRSGGGGGGAAPPGARGAERLRGSGAPARLPEVGGWALVRGGGGGTLVALPGFAPWQTLSYLCMLRTPAFQSPGSCREAEASPAYAAVVGQSEEAVAKQMQAITAGGAGPRVGWGE